MYIIKHKVLKCSITFFYSNKTLFDSKTQVSYFFKFFFFSQFKTFKTHRFMKLTFFLNVNYYTFFSNKF